MKKLYTVGISFVLLAFLLVVYLLVYMRPPIPTEWDNILLGLKREELLELHPTTYTAMKGEKGYDLLRKKNDWPYFRNGGWTALIYYNKDDEISEITYNYCDDGCGWLNKIVVKRAEE